MEEVVEEEAAPLAEATLVVAAVPLTPPWSAPWLTPPWRAVSGKGMWFGSGRRLSSAADTWLGIGLGLGLGLGLRLGIG